MKILLTGGKGFVASAVEKSLITDGHTVLNVSRSTSPKLKEVLASSQQFDFYIHTAALSKDSPFANPKDYQVSNVDLTKELLEHFESNGSAKKLIYLSTDYVSNNNYVTPYIDSKRKAERILSKSLWSSKITVLRPVLICHDDQPRGILGVIFKLRLKSGTVLKFPKGFGMEYVKISTVVLAVKNHLSRSSGNYEEIKLCDGYADLNNPKKWMSTFELTNIPAFVSIKLNANLLTALFSLGHALKLPLNLHFLKKLKA